MLGKHFSCLIFLYFFALPIFAQKKVLNKEACDNWVMYNLNGVISNDGKYVLYSYGSNKMQDGRVVGTDALVLTSSDKKHKSIFPNATSSSFSADSRYMFTILPNDTLLQFNLTEKKVQKLPNISSFSVPKQGNGRWLAYFTTGNIKSFILKDLALGKSKKYDDITDYSFDKEGNTLVLQASSSVMIVYLLKGLEKIICTSPSMSPIIFDKDNKQIAFLTNIKEGFQIRNYKFATDTATIIVDNLSREIKDKYKIANGPLQFSKDGDQVYFQISTFNKQRNNQSDNIITDAVTSWNYKDKYLQSQQKAELSQLSTTTYTAVGNLLNKKVILLESETERLYGVQGNNNYVLAYKVINEQESYWNGEDREISLISVHTGSHKLIKKGADSTLNQFQLSSSERFVIWFDKKQRNIFSYEIAKDTIRNLTEAISTNMYEKIPGNIDPHIAFSGIKWSMGDKNFLLQDRFDLWRIDPLGKNKPFNVTNGYGRKNRISFFNISEIEGDSGDRNPILLAGLNRETMENGFWRVNPTKQADPELCTMGRYVYYIPRLSNQLPIKAQDVSLYLVERSSSTEAPNLFLTKDFKSYIPVTDIQPQKEYNWMTSELIQWKLPNGNYTKGILYKPEDFDPSKKYPLIFTYYEQRSDELNLYLKPQLQRSRIDIPWFVNRGYLVLIPDMYYTKGHNGEGIVNTVTSAVEFLSHYSWVDIKKMGLQGHSFGGYETNYLITHTNIFAAAQEVAGQSNLVSGYGGMSQIEGISRQRLYEKAQGNIPCPPWICPELYIKNSPIFNIGQITTPIMMVHNQKDNAVPYTQAIEFFFSLRRAKKKAWLLEYENEGHILFNENNTLDLTLRTQQFFDHYLKDAPAPIWMTQGISYKNKNLKSGLALDTTGIKP
jgi:dienelactone hydrolase